MHSSREFQLYVVAMDRETEAFLKHYYPEIVTTYYRDVLKNLEWPANNIKALAQIQNRTWAQTCWTMASASLYSLLWDQEEATYLDSDLYFFDDPEYAFTEMGDAAVAIVPHNFPSHDYERLRPSGLFNVSWVTARYELGLSTIGDWFRNVVDKCDAESCGDQKYLDAWPEKLGKNLHIFQSKGLGSGPWNAYTYEIWKDPAGVTRVVDDRLIFYHFHEFRREGRMNRTGYEINYGQAKLIYEPYEKHFDEVAKRVSSLQSY